MLIKDDAKMKATEGLRKPDCLFIGYQKSGTTFVRDFLTQHPEIHWTRAGGYFLSSDPPQEGEKGYLQRFKDIPPRGSCWVDMLESLAVGTINRDGQQWARKHLIPDTQVDGHVLIPDPARVAGNIFGICGPVKIVVIIRNQLTWLRSNYFHYYDYLPQGGNDFLSFLRTLQGKALLDSGMYDTVIGHYKRLFGEEKVHVIPLETLQNDQQQVLSRLCGFLGVPAIEFVPKSVAYNAGRRGVPGPFLASMARMPGFRVLRVLKRCLPFHEQLTRRGVVDNPIDDSTRRLLGAVYAASNFRTSALLGVDLSALGYPS